MAEVGRKYTILGLIQVMRQGRGISAPSFIEYRGRKYRYERMEKDYADICDYSHWLSNDVASLIDNMVDIFDDEVTVIESPLILSAKEQSILRNLKLAFLSFNPEYDQHKIAVVKKTKTDICIEGDIPYDEKPYYRITAECSEDMFKNLIDYIYYKYDDLVSFNQEACHE